MRCDVAVERDRVVLPHVAAAFPNADHDVGQTAAAALRALIEEPGDVRVETDPRNVEERPIVEHPDVDRERLRSERGRERRAGRSRHAQPAGQAVAGTGRDEAQGRRAAGDRAARFVHRAVPAPHDDEVRAIGHGGRGQLARVARPFGEVNGCAEVSPLQLVANHLDAVACGVRVQARTRHRIDDRNDTHDVAVQPARADTARNRSASTERPML